MTVLSGLCVSKGNVKGIAHIVTDNDSLSALPRNTILVMKTLERNVLINLRENVVGVIAEHGNIGSHGAGILRQLKIPCILRINNATIRIKNGDKVELCGAKNCIICSRGIDESNPINEISDSIFNYKSISKEKFDIEDIRPVCSWNKPRPGRVYQKLRYDIICDVYASGAEYLYKLPHAYTRQDENGVLETYGIPRASDLCSFVLCHPEWLVKKAEERSREFESIKTSMEAMMLHANADNIQDVIMIFEESIELYRAIFKYVFLAQITSDEFINIYLDFIDFVTGKRMSKDILDMKSDYVEKCLASGIDPGGFQQWNGNVKPPHIWYGELNYTPFPEDNTVLNAIRDFKNGDKDHLLRDYKAFRVIVPLIYQLSEEFFYISRSINTFLVWSIVIIHKYICQFTKAKLSIEEFYNLTLSEVYKYIDIIKEATGMKYEFMKAFSPEKTLVKEFDYWLILVRENQLTLGDCYFVLKREIHSFGEMKPEESKELSVAMKWYEDRCRFLYGADKFNYVAAMMRDDFVHFHAFPRYSKPVSRYGIEWRDERWPRLIQFGPSVCEPQYYQYIKDDLAGNDYKRANL